MQSKAKTVKEYIAELPEDRRAAIETIRKTIVDNLDPDVSEVMSYGMIGYGVPHSVYPPGYHCDPKQMLPFAGLASQKQYISIYLMWLYYDCTDAQKGPAAEFAKEWQAAGKKLDMGKCCIRVKRLEDVPLEVLAKSVRSMPVAKFIKYYEASLAEQAAKKGKPAAKKPAPKKAAAKPAKPVAKKPAKKKA